MKDDKRLGTESVGRLFVGLAVPAVLAQLVNLLYNLVDRIYIGHIEGIGRLALTGVGICMPIIVLVNAFAMLCGMGGAPRAAICMGKGDNAAAEKILGNCTTMCIIIAVLFTVIMEIFAQPLLMAFGASADTIGYSLSYSRIYIAGTLFVMLTLGLNSFITTQGFSKISMITVVIGAVLNIGLDPLFMFAFGMGVKGAALATIISQAVSAVWVVLFLGGKRTMLKIRLKNLRLKAKIILPCMALGLSPFIMFSTESLITVCFNSSLQRYGGDLAVGAMTVLSSVMQFCMMPLNGLTQGAQPIISYNYGAGNRLRVKKAFKIMLISCVAYSMLCWALVIAMPGKVAAIFNSDPELIEYIKWPGICYLLSMGLFGVQIGCQQTFLALGNAKVSLFLAAFRKILLLIPLIYVVPLFVSDKCMGVFLAEPVADLIAVCTTATIFAVSFKRLMRRMSDEEKQK